MDISSIKSIADLQSALLNVRTCDEIEQLLKLDKIFGNIDLHFENELLLKYVCRNNMFDMLKYLISLEPSHGKFKLHVDRDVILDYVVENTLITNNLDMLKYLISLENTHGKFLLRKNNEYILKSVCSAKSDVPDKYFDLLEYLLSLEESSYTKYNIKIDNDYCMKEICKNNNIKMLQLILEHQKLEFIDFEFEGDKLFGRYALESHDLYRSCTNLDMLKKVEEKFNIIASMNMHELFRIDIALDTEMVNKICTIHNFTGRDREYIELMKHVVDGRLELDRETYNRIFSIKTDYNYDSIMTDDDGFVLINSGCVPDLDIAHDEQNMIITGCKITPTLISYDRLPIKTKEVYRKKNDWSILYDNNITSTQIHLAPDDLRESILVDKCKIYPPVLKDTPIYDTLFVTDVLLKQMHVYLMDYICVYMNAKKNEYSISVDIPIRISKTGKYIIRKRDNNKFSFMLPYLAMFLDTIDKTKYCNEMYHFDEKSDSYLNIKVENIPYAYNKLDDGIQIIFGKPSVIVGYGITNKDTGILEPIENMKNNGKYYIDMLIKLFIEQYIDVIALHIPQYMRLIEIAKIISIQNIDKVFRSEINNMTLNNNTGFLLSDAEKIKYRMFIPPKFIPADVISDPYKPYKGVCVDTVPFTIFNYSGGIVLNGIPKQSNIYDHKFKKDNDELNVKIATIINSMDFKPRDKDEPTIEAWTKEKCMTRCEGINPRNPWFNPLVLSKCGVVFDLEDPEPTICYNEMVLDYIRCHKDCRSWFRE